MPNSSEREAFSETFSRYNLIAAPKNFYFAPQCSGYKN
jgi:hypothetical protein